MQRYTYEVLNYPTGEIGVVAHLYSWKNTVIGGETLGGVSSADWSCRSEMKKRSREYPLTAFSFPLPFLRFFSQREGDPYKFFWQKSKKGIYC